MICAQVAAAVRDAGFHDGQVLKLVHLSADVDDANDANADGITSHVVSYSCLDPDTSQHEQTPPVRVPTAPSFAVANILFQLQSLSLSPAAHALLLLLGGVGASIAGDWVEGSLSFNFDLFSSHRMGSDDEQAEAAAAAAAAAAIERAQAAERRNLALEEEVLTVTRQVERALQAQRAAEDRAKQTEAKLRAVSASTYVRELYCDKVNSMQG